MRCPPEKLEARTHIVLYDADCGFCKLAVRWLLRLERSRRLRPVAIQDAEGQDLLREVPEAGRLDSAHLVTPEGALRSGGAAAAPLAQLLPGGSIAARLFSRFPSGTDRAYRWVAWHRVLFGRLGIRTDRRPGRPRAPYSPPRIESAGVSEDEVLPMSRRAGEGDHRPEPAPQIRDVKTVLLTTFKRDGAGVGTPVSIAFDGDRAFFRTWHKTWKAKRLARNPNVEVAPSTLRGEPTSPALPAQARLLEGQDARTAARALARRHPVLQRMLVPVTHRLMRYRTMHYELFWDKDGSGPGGDEAGSA